MILNTKVKSLKIDVFDSMESQLFLLKDIADLNLLSSRIHRIFHDICHLRHRRLTISHNFIRIGDNSFPSQLLHLKLIICPQFVKIVNEGKTSIFHH